MKLREKGKHPAEINDTAAAVDDEILNKSALAEKENTLSEMEAALKQLSPEQQQCIILFYLEKKSYNEIADKTGFTLMQVKSHIQNGKRNLKLLLEKKNYNGR